MSEFINIPIIKKISAKEETHPVLITILTHNLLPWQVIEVLEDRIRRIRSSISNDSVLTTKITSRLKSLISYVKSQSERAKRRTMIDSKMAVNSLIFISDIIDILPLNQEWIETLEKYNFQRFYFKHGMRFDIDYLDRLLTDFDFYDHIVIKDNKLHEHWIINSTKELLFYDNDSPYFELTRYLHEHFPPESGKIVLVHGADKDFRCDPHLIYTTKLNNAEILEIFAKHKQITTT